MQNELMEKARMYVADKFQRELSPNHTYHNFPHTVSVVKACDQLALYAGLSEEEREILGLAAYFHDVGFSEVYLDHEEASKRIAQAWLEQQNYPAPKIAQVLECIEVTKMTNKPHSPILEIMKDADFNNLGQKGYFEVVENLRREREYFLNENYTSTQWTKTNIAFLEAHEFYSDAGKHLFAGQKSENLKRMKKKIKKKKEKKRRALANAEDKTISDSRTAQMMFKTALRNHIDLTSIADNKANIMLSINALIVSITLPLLATRLERAPFLLAPSIILIITCLVSIIYATLSTRPIATTGLTNLDHIDHRQTNLFFFGNFYKMKFADYKTGLRRVMGDDLILDESIVSDLYFLGKALGTKFAYLRRCYSVFMYGITVTVIVFTIAAYFRNWFQVALMDWF